MTTSAQRGDCRFTATDETTIRAAMRDHLKTAASIGPRDGAHIAARAIGCTMLDLRDSERDLAEQWMTDEYIAHQRRMGA